MTTKTGNMTLDIRMSIMYMAMMKWSFDSKDKMILNTKGRATNHNHTGSAELAILK